MTFRIGREELLSSVMSSVEEPSSAEEEFLLKAEIKPTPKPAKKRPARKSGMAVAAVCKITPNVKTPVEKIRPHFLPRKSPVGKD